MTTYVITVPGTFTGDIEADTRARLGRALRPADPHGTDLGSAEDLDTVNVNDDGTFTLHLTVEADNNKHAEQEARRLADDALKTVGLDENTAPLGPAVITGIDSQVH
ncbi:hypothetical protein [Streptomyces seoulensis]|uniref:hypothetical protein n=1 Tax=Streptomyces seoulensis TaxID=73044 RepID=UPI0033B946B9